MVIPVGPAKGAQEIMLITRTGPHEYETDKLLGVRYVPLTDREK